MLRLRVKKIKWNQGGEMSRVTHYVKMNFAKESIRAFAKKKIPSFDQISIKI
jgi:hypothetical protein